ncbi:hypothetical protein [Rhizobium sp.]
MSRLLAIAMLLATALPAQAISRYSAQQLSCDEIASIIRGEGAAIFRYPSPRRAGFTLYDRYVRNSTYCANHQMLEKVYIPSSDGEQCLVQRCTSNSIVEP